MELLLKNDVPVEDQVENPIRFIGEKGYKVLVVGNSITLHSPKPEIGWTGDFGMAASCEEADFVHRLYTLCSERGKTRMCILQASVFEKYYYRDFIFDEYRAAKDFAADCVIMRISENVAPASKRSDIFLKRYKQFAGYLSGENAKLIFTTGFWKNEFADPIIKRAALDCKAELVELGDLGEDSAMRADGLFEHKGVAMHPGNRGMAAIAKRIFSVI